MKIAVCDDDPHDLQLALELVQQIPSAEYVFAFSSALSLYNSAENFDAVILDIEMEAPNGFEIALRLARQEHHPIIVFATNSASYAVQGYGLALRYLLKPLTSESITEALEAASQQLHSNRLTVVLDDVTHVVNVQDIYYAEVQGHHVTLHTAQSALHFRATLRDIAARLPQRCFCACHQSYLVNLLHIHSVSKDEVRLTNGIRIPISRRRQKEFMLAFHTFLGV